MRSGPDTSQWSITAIGFPGYRGVGGMRGSTESCYIQDRVNHRYRKSNVLNTALLVLYTYILTFCN